MKLMAFSLTTPQMRDRSKDVTRRIGWGDLKAGDQVCAIVKGQGLKKGQKVERIGVIEVVSNRPEPIGALADYPPVSAVSELYREGFPKLTPDEFISMFCKANRCDRNKIVNRIVFKHV